MNCKTSGDAPIALQIILNESEIRKVSGLKVGGVQIEGKKKAFCELESCFFFLVIFSLIVFLCTSKMISIA
jgi:hypothetical protein